MPIPPSKTARERTGSGRDSLARRPLGFSSNCTGSNPVGVCFLDASFSKVFVHMLVAVGYLPIYMQDMYFKVNSSCA